MDRIDEWRVFIAVARSGSFTAAAAQLALPRATVSLAVQRLEARLRTRLLNRTTRRVRLTEEGSALLDRAGALVADAEALEQSCRSGAGALTGHLRVTAPSRMARRWIAPALPDFLRLYPSLRITLDSGDDAVDLVRSGIDCAVRAGTLPDSGLIARPLGQLRLINCASPGYLARHGMPHTPADLPQHIAVQYAQRGTSRAAPWEWQDGGTRRLQTLSGAITVDSAETYIACALAGLGLIQIPAFDVHDELARGALIEVLSAWTPAPMPLQLVYPQRRYLAQRVQAWGDWLVPRFASLLGAGEPPAPPVKRPRRAVIAPSSP